MEKYESKQFGYFVVSLIAIAILVTNLTIAPSRFADYFSYVDLFDEYYFFRVETWFFFEPVSTFLFIALKHISKNTMDAVNIAHYLLGIFYVVFTVCIFKKYQVGWRSILLYFAVFGPLLAFVTIRATPAYLFALIAFFESLRARPVALVYVFLGTLFHMSAILALVPIILSLAQARYSILRWVYTAGLSTFLVILALAGLAALLQTYFNEVLYNAISTIPILSRYIVYVTSFNINQMDATVDASTPSEFHFVYLILTTIFVLTILTNKSNLCRRSRLFVLASYGIFLFLQFSPVSAFRQSVFWVLPMIFVFPWAKYTAGRFGAYPMFVVASAIFLFQLSTVYQ